MGQMMQTVGKPPKQAIRDLGVAGYGSHPLMKNMLLNFVGMDSRLAVSHLTQHGKMFSDERQRSGSFFTN